MRSWRRRRGLKRRKPRTVNERLGFRIGKSGEPREPDELVFRKNRSVHFPPPRSVQFDRKSPRPQDADGAIRRPVPSPARCRAAAHGRAPKAKRGRAALAPAPPSATLGDAESPSEGESVM